MTDKTALLNNTYGFQFASVTGTDINNVTFSTANDGFYILDRNT